MGPGCRRGRADCEKFKKLILKPGADLAKPFLWGTGQNLLREALLIADHNAYHIGELVVLRRLLERGSEHFVRSWTLRVKAKNRKIK